MARYEYDYSTHNPGQYPAQALQDINAKAAQGWAVHTAMPNYGEIYLFWVREIPEQPQEKADEEQPEAQAPAPSGEREAANGSE